MLEQWCIHLKTILFLFLAKQKTEVTTYTSDKTHKTLSHSFTFLTHGSSHRLYDG